MNLKRIFGTILTSLGIIILLYGGYNFINASANKEWKIIMTTSILGIIFFVSGIGLIKTTKDEA